jgi:hypothetical protein
MNLQVPYSAGNFLTSLKPVSFSRKMLLHEAWSMEYEVLNSVKRHIMKMPEMILYYNSNHSPTGKD